jgi:hypothetical protein
MSRVDSTWDTDCQRNRFVDIVEAWPIQEWPASVLAAVSGLLEFVLSQRESGGTDAAILELVKR